VDVSLLLPPTEQAARARAAEVYVRTSCSSGGDTLLNPDTKALNDSFARIAHASTSGSVEKGYFGQGRPAISPIPSNLAWAHNPKVAVYGHDPARAAALLDEAGYPRGAGGERLTLRLAYDPANSAANKASEVVAQQLRGVGIAVRQTPMERSLMLDKVFKQYEFDLFIHNYTTYGDPALGVTRAYACDNIRPAPFVNVERYCNERVDELFRLAAAGTTQAERARHYQAAQEIIARELPTIPLIEYGDTNVARGRVRNIFRSLSSHERWDEVWVSDGK
jgi:peptide/nickel transport system substrate-binding protein